MNQQCTAYINLSVHATCRVTVGFLAVGFLPVGFLAVGFLAADDQYTR